MENDKRVLSEIDRSKEMINFSTKPKKVIKPEQEPKETITEGTEIVSLSEFVKG